ncbi:unnamed protein product [Sphacelaria rigidula]
MDAGEIGRAREGIRGTDRRDTDENISARPNGLREKVVGAIRAGDLDLPVKRKRCTRFLVEDQVNAQNCRCGKVPENLCHIVAERELYTEEPEVLKGGNARSKRRWHEVVWYIR